MPSCKDTESVPTLTDASGSKRVTGFREVGDSIDFGRLPLRQATQDGLDSRRLYVRYSQKEHLGKQASVYLDDEDVATVHFGPTSAITGYNTTFVYLPRAGVVRLQIDPDDYMVNLGKSAGDIDRASLADGDNFCVISTDDDIQDRLDAAMRGDTFVLGIDATMEVSRGFDIEHSLTLGRNGTRDRPITLRAQRPGNIVFSSGSSLLIEGDYVVVDGLAFAGWTPIVERRVIEVAESASYTRLTNLSMVSYDTYDPCVDDGGECEAELDGCPYPDCQGNECNIECLCEHGLCDDQVCNRFTPSSWIYFNGDHGRVDHCHFANKENQDVVVDFRQADDDPKYNTADHNYFGPRPNGADSNGWEDFRAGGGSATPLDPAHVMVNHNLFSGFNGEPEIISNKSAGNYYFYNTFRDNPDGELVVRIGEDVWIEGNVFLGGKGGIRVHGSGHVIVNNHFQDVATGIKLALGHDRDGSYEANAPDDPDHPNFRGTCYWPVEDVVLSHNTMVNVQDGVAIHQSSRCLGEDDGTQLQPSVSPRRVVLTNSLVKPTGTTVNDAVGDVSRIFMLSNITTLANAPLGFTTSQVRFWTRSDGLIAPYPFGSPVLNAGLTASQINSQLPKGYPQHSEVAFDWQGQARDTPDVGADELLTGTPAVVEPLTVDDVGPRWGGRFDDQFQTCQ